MANYHLLQSKEHNDEEEETGHATPSPAGTESAESMLWKYISIFLAFCIIIVTFARCRSCSQLCLNGATFTEDLSFLSTFLQRNLHLCEILADGDPPPFLSRPSRPHHQNIHQRP